MRRCATKRGEYDGLDAVLQAKLGLYPADLDFAVLSGRNTLAEIPNRHCQRHRVDVSLAASHDGNREKGGYDG